ncbi:DNA alkylation repair protein [Labedaea rhizosphaerae]|uniref:3-methyladenine DNA glycosylase AlkD n=1 Tax=Labedaea rhizosphaerae TaxID=598644 RepID=A0A4R6RTP1_LABRH|nr:DNA alkylation repair protein [Labedaea rhizosphaerae]TDP89386.1 3-methyladenine DNA glycosylase AlkD [Labedaea rhizosphaerae]
MEDDACGDRALIAAARSSLAEAADPAKAPDMQRYMRSDMPFRGVAKPERAVIARNVFADFPLPSPQALVATARMLWDEAEFREERYLAVDLTGYRAYRAYRDWQRPDLVPLYEHMIVTGAWWDHVDEIASRRIGPLLLAFPEEIAPVMRAWSRDPDLWRRRTSIICQLAAKERTDVPLLAECLEAGIGDKDFFIRKAIGWALRQHARIDPDWVRAFVASHPDLSPLSVREATKHL